MSDASDEVMKDCPFCGEAGRLRHDKSSDYEIHWSWFAHCSECDAQTDYRKDKRAARNLWNRRAKVSQ